MTWTLSHTDTGRENARTNIQNLPATVLREIYAEIRTSQADPDDYAGDFAAFQNAISAHTNNAARLPLDVIAGYIEEFALETQRETTNGGHRLYLCPYYCDAHTVSFDPPQD